MTTYLLDANVLIALTVREHEHHDRCSRWFGGFSTDDGFATCPTVEGALLRFLVRVGERSSAAQAVVTALRSDPRHAFWPDALSYADVDLAGVRGHRQVTDSYLATLAADRAALLATLDEPLAGRYPDRCLLVPAVDAC